VYPLLSWSGVMDTLDQHGFNLQVKRSYPGSKIRLAVDPVACAGRHKYELRVDVELGTFLSIPLLAFCSHTHTLLLLGISVIASDQTGLLYACYALVQLLSLHSNVIRNGGVTTLSVPSVRIIDYPDVANRGNKKILFYPPPPPPQLNKVIIKKY